MPNGPGDPEECRQYAARCRELADGSLPVAGRDLVVFDHCMKGLLMADPRNYCVHETSQGRHPSHHPRHQERR